MTTAPTGDDPSWTYLVVFFVAVLVVCCIIAVVFSAFAVRCLVRASRAKRRPSIADNGKYRLHEIRYEETSVTDNSQYSIEIKKTRF